MENARSNVLFREERRMNEKYVIETCAFGVFYELVSCISLICGRRDFEALHSKLIESFIS